MKGLNYRSRFGLWVLPLALIGGLVAGAGVTFAIWWSFSGCYSHKNQQVQNWARQKIEAYNSEALFEGVDFDTMTFTELDEQVDWKLVHAQSAMDSYALEMTFHFHEELQQAETEEEKESVNARFHTVRQLIATEG